MKRREVIRALTGTALVSSLRAATTPVADTLVNASGQQSNQAPANTTPEKLSATAVRVLDLSQLPATLVSGLDSPQIAKGRTPLLRDEAKWKNTVANFLAQYGPVPQRAPDGQLTFIGRPTADRKLSIRGLPIDKAASAQFVFSQVELLLNQAADLLDRASQMRDQLKDKTAKLASLALEISDFFANDSIHQDEIAAGIYTTPYEVSAADERSQLQRKSGADNFLFFNQTLINTYYSMDAINQASGRSQLLAWLPFIPTFQYPFVGDPLTQTFNNVPLTSAQHAISATFDLSMRSAYLERYALLSQSALQTSASAAFQAAFEGAQAKRKWDDADIDFKRRRTQAARDNADEKVRLSTVPAGAYNYAEQVDSITRRMTRDLTDALVRLIAAAEGLKIIYGRDVPLPGDVKLILAGASDEFDLVTVLDEALIWVRNAIAYIVAFTQYDQSCTFTVSLKRSLPTHPWPHESKEWHDGQKSGSWKFVFDDEWLPHCYHVRARGISVCTRGTNGIWRGTIAPPKASFFRYFQNKSMNVDQSHVPTVLLGRVGTRSPDWTGDVLGKTVFRNVAPFGEWTITMDAKSTQDESREDIEDIEIDFDLAIASPR